ncbi:MAG: type VI secretion system tip protein VgrG [Proteobacteria bacterium]|nr:type VI secretion system tip protein VgrG [Pseudomonadota bacterium]
MSATQGQTQRLLSLQTDLRGGALEPVAFSAEESISTPFSVTVDAISDQATIDANSILYTPAALKITYGDGEPRVIHGMVRTFTAAGQPLRGRFADRLTIAPRLWFMGQTADCRIFCNKTTIDIVTTLCNEMDQALDVRVQGAGPSLPYVTQYNETDLAFLTRLLEEAGYFYYFTHTTSNHTLVVANQNQGFASGDPPAMTVAEEGGGTHVLTHWHRLGSTVHGKIKLRDYNLEQPSTRPDATHQTVLATPGASTRDVFVWPAQAATQAEADRSSRIRMEAAEAQAALIGAAGAHPALGAGSRFKVTKDPYDDAGDVEYIVRSISSNGEDRGWITGDGAATYGNRIVAFKASIPWREKLATPRPVMSGIHSAVVLGGGSDEIHADRYGRVKVRFHWDHREDATSDTACWVRVVQPWAGNTWGWQHLPRVGTEVAVAFLDGDPDRPVVIGGLYNAEMMPVFPIPGEQTKSGFRSRSTAQGSTSTVSELSFDDKKGSEKVYLHAEKDMTLEVEHDRSEEIGNDDTLTVKHDRTETIDNKQTTTIKNGRTTTIKAGGDALTVENGGVTVTAKMQDIAIKAELGALKLEAMQSIELKVGGNKITIDNTGVTIDALQLKLQGQGMVQIKGPMTQVNGDGMLMLKGGVMMLN